MFSLDNWQNTSFMILSGQLPLFVCFLVKINQISLATFFSVELLRVTPARTLCTHHACKSATILNIILYLKYQIFIEINIINKWFSYFFTFYSSITFLTQYLYNRQRSETLHDFHDSDERCCSPIPIDFFTGCKQSWLRVIWLYEQTLACKNTDMWSYRTFS